MDVVVAQEKVEPVDPAADQEVVLVGGSNTIAREGYAKILRETYGDRVRSFSLGASTSLFGLCNSTARDIFKANRTYVFEYTINDVSYFWRGLYSAGLLERVLFTFCTEVQKAGARAVFPLFAPRYALDDVLVGGCPVTATYKKITALFGFPHLDVTRFLMSEHRTSRDQMNRRYHDDMHYNTGTSKLIGAKVLSMVQAQLAGEVAPPTKPVWPSVEPLALRLINAADLEVSGPHTFVERKSSLVSGLALRLEPGSHIKLREGGQLLGFIANTCGESGFVRFTGEHRTFAKNMFDGFYTGPNTARIFLKQIGRPLNIVPGVGVEVACDLTAERLTQMEIEGTTHERPPLVTPEQTCFEICAAVVAD